MASDLDELTGGKPVIGRRAGGEPVDEAEHFCMRDLAQVLHHHNAGHAPLTETELAGRSAKVLAGTPKQ